ncbi:MAG: DotU family type IV/VI secretion system protein [Myxococcota bacterium]|nr:DotU family type IV/VI secretion system protein [Myxococcota bacterium]
MGVANAVYLSSAETLMAALRFGLEKDPPPPERLRAEMLGKLQKMVGDCRARGVAEADVQAAHYALVAFIDDCVLKSNWAGRAEWMNNPLQMQLYHEYTAGENFFAHMSTLLQYPRAPAALEVYYLCLTLGFTGALPVASSQSYVEAARARLSVPHQGTTIAPRALPPDHHTLTNPRRPIIWAMGLSCFLVVVLGLALLGWSLSRTLWATQHDLAAETARAKAASTER